MLKRIDWYNVLRTLAQAFIVVIGVVLPMLTTSWWSAIGVPADTVAPILGVAALALSAWWRQKYQHAFEPLPADVMLPDEPPMEAAPGEAAPPAPEVMPTLRLPANSVLSIGSRGNAVRTLQQAYGIEPADGYFDASLERIVIERQKYLGVAPDGKVDAALFEALVYP